jgi:hypothetical protein
VCTVAVVIAIVVVVVETVCCDNVDGWLSSSLRGGSFVESPPVGTFIYARVTHLSTHCDTPMQTGSIFMSELRQHKEKNETPSSNFQKIFVDCPKRALCPINININTENLFMMVHLYAMKGFLGLSNIKSSQAIVHLCIRVASKWMSPYIPSAWLLTGS